MCIMKIEFAGVTKKGQVIPDAFATIHRPLGSDQIDVTILARGKKERTHHVQADCQEYIWSMAECLQEILDGYVGSNSEVHDYYSESAT